MSSSQRTPGQRTSGRAAAKSVRPPRFGPAWYRKRRLATRRRVAAMSRSRRSWRRIGLFGTWLLAGLAVVLVVAVVAFYQLSDVVTPDKIVTDQVATVLYSDGSVMARLGAENRTDVSIDKVPADVKWAVLAAEDRSYYSNPGISVTGTLRAAWNDATGGSTQGGSGITQQYVKNAYLNSDQTLSRKLRELAIAVKLDRNYSKDTILEYYLNTIYFGRGAYGIQAAAQTYFGADVTTLDVAQGAVLAALIRSPGDYDPATDAQAAKDRFGYVLSGMVATGHLTQAQADATAYPTVQPIADNGIGVPSGPTGLIVNQVIDELKADGIEEQTLNTRGLTIKTTIDPKAQTDAQQTIDSIYGNLAGFQQNIKKALVATDPSTGAVLAYWGGAYTTDDQNDYAGGTCQSPGSSFKPYTLAVGLTNALQGAKPGYTLNTRVDGSSPQKIGGVSISNDPSDAAYESSSITVGRAMEVSLNTVFDAMANAVGPDNVATMAHAAGIATTCNGDPTLVNAASDANPGETGFGIGIGDYPVHTIDQAIGFGTFADGGVHHAAYFISSVTAADGTTLFTHQDAPQQVMDPKVANDVTASLVPVAGFSLNPLANGRASASKTGTYGVEFCSDGSKPDEAAIRADRDCSSVGQNSRAWTVGFTPSVSVASFAGSADPTDAIYGSTNTTNPSAGSKKAEYGRDLPGRAWKAFLDTYLSGTPNQAISTKAEVTTGGQNTSAPTGNSGNGRSSGTGDNGGSSSSASSPAASSTAPTDSGSPTAPVSPTDPSTPTPTPTAPTTPPTTPTGRGNGGGNGGGGGGGGG